MKRKTYSLKEQKEYQEHKIKYHLNKIEYHRKILNDIEEQIHNKMNTEQRKD